MIFSRKLKLLLVLFFVTFQLFGSVSQAKLCSEVFSPQRVIDRSLTDEEIILLVAAAVVLSEGGVTNAPAPRAQVDYGRNEVARHYANLAREGLLINQSDPSLGSHGLLKPNGGLCATACVVNTIEMPVWELILLILLNLLMNFLK